MKPQLGLFLGLVIVLAGCGPTMHQVSGTVKLDGQPLPDGLISFTVEGIGAGGNSPISNGAYSVRVPQGKAKVQITASKMMKLPPGEKGMFGKTEEMRQYIPDSYNAKSKLTADITGANSQLDFDLKSSGHE